MPKVDVMTCPKPPHVARNASTRSPYNTIFYQEAGQTRKWVTSHFPRAQPFWGTSRRLSLDQEICEN
ncbi:hypothetical protein K435DRAFT_880628 [Dendrothele bispora CBS 962.96]|uniref:Uncharacterized protein n=1 Tax=Dendrothele bispora (strain CBS 962.96) TaxID=1314807 RepID=A0A4S8KJL1_DENBC|nr:hypothetical protein K435DRAFT_880628 [Dendrothele bispora CBS 962.96]